MQKRHSTVLKALAGLAFGLALTATSAQAQAEACVKNGGLYMAKMAVWIGTTQHTTLSDDYSQGYWRCQSLSGVPDGTSYSVKVKVPLGGLGTCEKDNSLVRSAADKSNIYFVSGGLSVSPTCGFTNQRP